MRHKPATQRHVPVSVVTSMQPDGATPAVAWRRNDGRGVHFQKRSVTSAVEERVRRARGRRHAAVAADHHRSLIAARSSSRGKPERSNNNVIG